MKGIGFVLLIGTLILLTGCAGSTPRQRSTTYRLANGGQQTITQDLDWSTSGNLSMYYDHETAIVQSDTAMKSAKIEGLVQNSQAIAELKGLDPVAKAFAIQANSLMIGMISTNTPQASSPPPKTATNVIAGEGGIVSRLAEMVVGGALNKWVFGGDVLPYGSGGGEGGGDTIVFDHSNIGGDFASKAVIHKDQNPYIEAGGVYNPTEAPTFNIPFTTTDSHDSASRNTDSHNDSSVTQ